ncbi:virulence factor [Pseudogemmobacter faecipullorum]|uniref:Virulence factor n=1 Tax=Pseudogemmobacter faecipullorum TaxID=2755041 RepID=A0ABS8CKC2_9RHOB|nr:virulence factor [Pseudogemmobacter faecipullorum]MCB5409310.1 virulence factor [Pseudogemmobacter faecipullorum]
MPEITIVCWRDIPAQVIIGKGRRGTKVQLPERFEQAIDRCAMKIGARDSDAYLAEWRKISRGEAEGEPEELAKATAAALEAEYDAEKIRALIASDGWASPPADA